MIIVSSVLLILAVVSRVGCQRNTPRSARASRNEAVLEFECPEEFGYYPHPRDCTQYYVVPVFWRCLAGVLHGRSHVQSLEEALLPIDYFAARRNAAPASFGIEALKIPRVPRLRAR
ncbi:uncharacterized protein LOC105425270 [Pogonomyrmex barbatus]|uniref:Uncharacterized protein LOC105425270 n=1 Tax=Pogonomyrmex barbatus TaxID=144034 RepID=A0A6I9VYC1_9HYME|nr:uncharacterized protein LOC105425270 [Pogonomyrmex barbatus]